MSELRPRCGFPDLGYGLGLRAEHYRHVLDHAPAVDWFEVISENYLNCHGWRRHVLECVAQRYPVVMHGVSLSIGSAQPLDFAYLAALKALAADIGARWISDHVCWTGVAGHTTHDLLPLPLDEATLAHVVDRVRAVQDFLQQRIVLENPSSYARFRSDAMPEWEFIARLSEAADCGLLLDVNNVYVSGVNHGFDPYAYLDAIPVERVVQLHVAGHRHCGTHIVDTHDAPVAAPVRALHAHARRRFGAVSTLLEWDARLPSFGELQAELAAVRAGSETPAATVGAVAVPHAAANAPLDACAHPLAAGAGFQP